MTDDQEFGRGRIFQELGDLLQCRIGPGFDIGLVEVEVDPVQGDSSRANNGLGDVACLYHDHPPIRQLQARPLRHAPSATAA